MFTLPELDNKALGEEDFFDVEMLPDLDAATSSQFIDLKNQSAEENKVAEKHRIKLPKDEGNNFNDAKCKRTETKLFLSFKISPDEMKAVTSMTFGMISSEVQEGQYEFDIQKNADGVEELYYWDEYVGEFVDNEPRIYKRYFSSAVIRSMVKQEILYEYEKNKLTIHPLFILKIKMYNSQVAEMLMKKGFVKFTVEDIESMKSEESKLNPEQESRENTLKKLM
jgi:hypothetical protein